jgi:hypothetical protein
VCGLSGFGIASRLNSCWLIDTTVTAHLPGPQNPRVCHLNFAEGCHLYIACTVNVGARLKSHYFSPIEMSLGRRTEPERNGAIALGWARVAGSRAEAGLPVRAAQPLRPSLVPSTLE